MEKFTAIYVRRSVSDAEKGNNSLSISAQKEECIRYLGENSDFRIYCDDGKSGKDIRHRPSFQQMMSDARDGLIDKIIVKKYDRFSRNMREYLNITDDLDKLGISVISLSEPFNTETKEGRMMRNNLLNFAEFERETIAARVADAYNTKVTETGFYPGGKVNFGYKTERRTINGKTGSVLVPSELAETVIAMYEVYKDPCTSLKDVVEYIVDNKLPVRKSSDDPFQCKKMDRSHISRVLSSPLYVKADHDVYSFFLSKGYEMIDDVGAYDGIHGLMRHTSSDGGKFIKVAYHEGIVSSDTWLAVQDKKARNFTVPHTSKEPSSWLVGLVKCAHCGRALLTSYNHRKSENSRRCYSDSGAYTVQGCLKKRLKIFTPDNVESKVFKEMKAHLNHYHSVRTSKSQTAESDRIRAEIIRTETEINKLMGKLADADAVLFRYIQKRINELHLYKSESEQKLMMIARRQKDFDTKPFFEPLSKWDILSIREKHEIASAMIDKIYISDETGIDIHFSF